MGTNRRYVQVGLGGRHSMFRQAILGPFSQQASLVGLCDSNEGRLQLAAKGVLAATGKEVPTFLAGDFDAMIRQTGPDAVIVTSKDCTHDKYICRAMELGCDAITEKPMTIDERKCRRILETQKATGRKVRVTFNYRYAPPRTQIKDLLMAGVIGEVLSVDFHWLLNVHHGADYFRRWHRQKANSGGLLVHKATHHFDLVNWWLSSVPRQVFASGSRQFYLPSTADRYGLTPRGRRCLGCAQSGRCPFYLDLAGNEGLNRLYLDNEQYDGYFRDGCVFSPEIDIEDSVSMVVDYANGVRLSYSLEAFMPWEGYLVSFNGTKGRLEHKCEESVYVSGDGTVPGALRKEGTWTRVFPHRKPAYQVELWTGTGGHGGGDTVLLQDLFAENPPPDRYVRAADQRAGAWSILVGVAANRSIDSGKAVRIDDLVADIAMPDYPPMPTRNDPLPLA